ncbi:hypothetical protein ACIA8K_11455 [Catenuloplanes sp. NPDC051500]|uniref:hypothetical protein n=1 Tax=Catenuloplanes sp. NPDC051500 TaxID=3363959 RepID=UPI0037974865
MERATATEFEAGQAFAADASAPMWEVPDRPGEQRAAIFGGPAAPQVSPAAAPSPASPQASAPTPAPESAFDPEADLEDRFPQAPQTNRDAWRGIETPGSASTLAKRANSSAPPPHREEPVMIDLGTPSGVSAEPRGLRALLAGLTGRAKGAGAPKPPKRSKKGRQAAADENPWAGSDGLNSPETRGPSDGGTHDGGRTGVDGSPDGGRPGAGGSRDGGQPGFGGVSEGAARAGTAGAGGPDAGGPRVDSTDSHSPGVAGSRGKQAWPAPVPQNGPFGGVQAPGTGGTASAWSAQTPDDAARLPDAFSGPSGGSAPATFGGTTDRTGVSPGSGITPADTGPTEVGGPAGGGGFAAFGGPVGASDGSGSATFSGPAGASDSAGFPTPNGPGFAAFGGPADSSGSTGVPTSDGPGGASDGFGYPAGGPAASGGHPAFGGPAASPGADGSSTFSAFGGPAAGSAHPVSDLPGVAAFPADSGGSAAAADSAANPDNPENSSGTRSWGSPASWPATPTPSTGMPAQAPVSWPDARTPEAPVSAAPPQPTSVPAQPVFAPEPPPFDAGASFGGKAQGTSTDASFGAKAQAAGAGAQADGAGAASFGAEAQITSAGASSFGGDARTTGAGSPAAQGAGAPMWGTAALDSGAGTTGAGKASGSGSEWFTHVEPRLSDPSAPSGPAWVETPKNTGETSQNWTELTLSAPAAPAAQPAPATPSVPGAQSFPGAQSLSGAQPFAAGQSGPAPQSFPAGQPDPAPQPFPAGQPGPALQPFPAEQSASAGQSLPGAYSVPTEAAAPVPGQADRPAAWNEPTRNGPIWTSGAAPAAAKPWTEAESQNGWAERPPVVDLWADPDGKSWTTTKPVTSDTAVPDAPAPDSPAPKVPTSKAPRSKSAAAKSPSHAPSKSATGETPVVKAPQHGAAAASSATHAAGVPRRDEPATGDPRGSDHSTTPRWDESTTHRQDTPDPSSATLRRDGPEASRQDRPATSRRDEPDVSRQSRAGVFRQDERAAAPGWDEPAARDADDPYAMYRRPGAIDDDAAGSRHAATDGGVKGDDGDKGWQEIPLPSWSDQPATDSWNSGPSWAGGTGQTTAGRGTRETPPGRTPDWDGRAERVGEDGTDVPRPANGWTAGLDDRATGHDRFTGQDRATGQDQRAEGTPTTGRDQVPGHDRYPAEPAHSDRSHAGRFQPGPEEAWTAVPAPPPHLATQPSPGPDRPAPPGRRAADHRRREENPRHGDRSSESYPQDVIDLGGAKPRSRRAKVLVTLGIVVVAVAVVGGMLTALRNVTGLNLAAAGGGPHAISAPLDGRNALAFDLVSGVTSVTVISDDLQGDLYRIATPEDSSIRPQAVDQGERVQLQMFETGQSGPNLVEIRLSSEVAWDLRLTGGATEHVIDFSRGRVSGFDMLGGATRLELTLPEPDASVKLKVSSGLSQFVLRTPAKTPSRLRFGAGADSVTLRGDGRGRAAPNSRFTPKAWEAAESRYDIDIAAGVGTFTLE